VAVNSKVVGLAPGIGTNSAEKFFFFQKYLQETASLPE
jgi:hypothetical protein